MWKKLVVEILIYNNSDFFGKFNSIYIFLLKTLAVICFRAIIGHSLLDRKPTSVCKLLYLKQRGCSSLRSWARCTQFCRQWALSMNQLILGPRVTLNPLNPGPQKWFKLEDMFRDTLGWNIGGWLGYYVSPRHNTFDNQKLREVLSLPKFIFNSMYMVYVHLTLQFIQ